MKTWLITPQKALAGYGQKQRGSTASYTFYAISYAKACRQHPLGILPGEALPTPPYECR